jgi:Flp pilus assembly protein TadG
MTWNIKNRNWRTGDPTGQLRSSLRPFSAKRRGAAILETALVMVILIYMSFGAAETGYFLWVKHSMEGAAREGARAAITANATQQDVTDAIYQATDAVGIARKDISYSITVGSAAGAAVGDVSTVPEGTGICVQVICNWKDVGIHPMNFFGDTATGAAVMRKEGS